MLIGKEDHDSNKAHNKLLWERLHVCLRDHVEIIYQKNNTLKRHMRKINTSVLHQIVLILISHFHIIWDDITNEKSIKYCYNKNIVQATIIV